MHTYLPNLALEEPEERDDQVFFFNSNLLDLCPFLLNEYVIGRKKLGDISLNFRLDEVWANLKVRWHIPFFSIQSERFEKTEQELKAYEMPITKIIEENSVKDLQEITDAQSLSFITT